jgi:hypothetical protein
MATKKAAQPQVVAGTVIAKTDAKLIKEALASFLPDKVKEIGDDVTAAVQALSNLFGTKYGVDDLCVCPVCCGTTPRDLDVCPFCGDSGEDPTASSKSEKGASTPPPPIATRASVAPSAPEAPTAAMVVRESAIANFTTEKPSEELLNRVTQFTVDVYHGISEVTWLTGYSLKVALDRELWKQRTDAAGKPVYESFNQWVERECKIKSQNAYKLADIAAKFTIEQARGLGITKLMFLMRGAVLPAEEAEKLLAAAPQVSKRELAAMLKEAKAKTGNEDARRQEPGRKKMPKGKPGRKPKPGGTVEVKVGADGTLTTADGRMTIAMTEGTKTLPFYKKTAGKNLELVPAKKLSDEPIAKEELENAVTRLYYVVQNPAGEWRLRIVTKRGA